MKKISIPIIILIIFSFMISMYAYQNIQGNMVASHWNAKGEVDGYMTKFWGLFLFPFILIGMYAMYTLIPRIDPLKKNIENFRKYYDMIILAIMVFLFYIFLLSIFFNLGYAFNMTIMILPAIGMLFFIIGIFMPKLKRNWFIGIRTPWTISNDKVWEKTHVLGGKLFISLGIIIFFGMLFKEYLMWIILIPTMSAIIWLFIYSYLEFRKIEDR